MKSRLLGLFKLCNVTARNIWQEWILKPELLASIQLCNFTAIPPQKNDQIFKDSLKIRHPKYGMVFFEKALERGFV